MATILTKIKRFVRSGQAEISRHALTELNKDCFTVADAKHAILSAMEFDELTDDTSHVRYVLYGETADGVPLNIVLFFRGRSVKIKTAYKPIKIMKCECGGNEKKKRISTKLELSGRKVLIEDIDAKVCDKCGETYFNLDELIKIEKQIQRKQRQAA